MKQYVVQNRKPERLFRFFEDLNAIPRGSYHEKQVSDFLVAFAAERGLPVWQDDAWNVFVKIPASAGRESEPAVLLQGHMDIVCEKNADTVHDFEKDGIEMYVDGKFLRAKGTTLGGDDGIAVAAMMALMDGELSDHPALECLITTAEETGLDGARVFDYSRVSATRMINLDSESEGQVTVGCAGGMRTDFRFAISRTAFSGSPLSVTVKGLAGGHSGENINAGRANANKLMGRILAGVPGLSLISIRGGSKDNAIPRECVAEIAVRDPDEAKAYFGRITEAIRGELSPEDVGFALFVAEIAAPDRMMDADSTRRVVGTLAGVANGVLAMSQNIPGLVEYSRSLGVVRTEEDVTFVFSTRSAIESQIDASACELDAVAAMVNATTRHHSRYPGWSFSKNSPLREAWLSACERELGATPKVTVIHAGLECGIISSRLPDLDMISVGPDMRDIHSPDEALDLDSCERIFRVLSSVLR